MAPVGSNTRPSASLPLPHPAPVSTIIIISTVIPSTLVLLMLVCIVVVLIMIVRWRITRKQVDAAHEHKGKLLSLSSRSHAFVSLFCVSTKSRKEQICNVTSQFLKQMLNLAHIYMVYHIKACVLLKKFPFCFEMLWNYHYSSVRVHNSDNP